MFVDATDHVVVEEEGGERGIGMFVEWIVEEGRVVVRLDEKEEFVVRTEGVEGSFVAGLVGGDSVGVVDVSKVQVHIESPETPLTLVRESIHKVPSPTLPRLYLCLYVFVFQRVRVRGFMLGKRFYALFGNEVRSIERWRGY